MRTKMRMYTMLALLFTMAILQSCFLTPEEKCKPPEFSKPSGAYPHFPLSNSNYPGIIMGGVDIYCETAGATIKYTTNGSLPDLSGGLTYTGRLLPYLHNTVVVIKERAYKDGYEESEIVTVTYTDDGTN